MQRIGKVALLALLTIVGSFGTLSADDSTHTLYVDTWKVNGRTHTDDFSGWRVVVAEVQDPKGIPVGGASVQIDTGNTTSILISTPSGIRVIVDQDGKIAAIPGEKEPAAPSAETAAPAATP